MYNKKKLTTRAAIKRRITAKAKNSKFTTRLSIYKSNTSLYAQIIDDTKWITLFSAKAKRWIKWAEQVWKEIATKAWKIKLNFDRNWFLYHWLIKTLADSARKNWLIF